MKKINKYWVAGIVFCFMPSLGMAGFIDVDVTHPNYYAITSLEADTVIRGYDGKDTFFRPRWKVNRAEALKILTLAAKLPLDLNSVGNLFPDVKKEHWFYEPVKAAIQRGIVQGYPNGKFHPEKEVSLAEFLKMLMVSFDIPLEELTSEEEWFVPYLKKAKKLRLVDTSDPIPHASLTRGEVAELIYRTQILAEVSFEEKYIYTGEGIASYYDEGFAGRPTANGEIYHPTDLTAAHRILPFGTRLKVWNNKNDYVIVRINDRGPYVKNRVLDLSPTAFKKLADLSDGLTYVHFEIYSDTVEEHPTVPEQIRPKLSSQLKNAKVPNVLAELFTKGRIKKIPNEKKNTTVKNIESHIPAYISGTVPHIPKNFFPNATLRREIPQKIVQGTVLNIAGTAKETGKKEAVIFLQRLNKDGQNHFSAKLSGRNFTIPVMFLETGNFDLGLIFDEQVKSRVEKIEVVAPQRTKLFMPPDQDYISDLDVRVIPEDEQVVLTWQSGENRLTKLIFSQEEIEKELYFEDEISQISLPFAFFEVFQPHQILAIDILQAPSKDSILRNQNTDWENVTFKNFILVPGFKDTESEKVSIHKFPRFLKSLNKVELDGKVLVPGVYLPENAYLITPEKGVREMHLEKKGDYFSFTVIPDKHGTYVLEVVSDEGEVLFNRGMYFYDQVVLPITEWEQVSTRSASVVGVRNWINRLRKKHRLQRLDADAKLNIFAQDYAQKMADDDYISHTSPEGLTFQQRVKMAQLIGEYGENLSYGSTFALAMNGLENSASHLKNILSERWVRVGVGITQNEEGEYYVVQMFGK